jgi:hypothetical protein
MIIPILNLEESVQTNDLTRFDASKTIKAKGGLAGDINSVKIKAGANGSDIELYEVDNSAWFLDWVFTGQNFDVDSYNNVLNFEVGGVAYRALVADGTYTLASLLTAAKNAIEALASPLTANFTVDVNNRITISPSLPIKLLLNKEPACLLSLLNFYDKDILVSLPVEFSIKVITLTVTTSALESVTLVKHIKVFTPESDRLFASDSDLIIRERDIMSWAADGRSSFMAEHRKVQTEIIDWLFKEGYYDNKNRALTKWSIVHTKELRQWAIYKTLSALMLSFSNSVDDVFIKKYEKYNKLEIDSRKIYSITLDTNNDGVADQSQDVGTAEGTLVHR